MSGSSPSSGERNDIDTFSPDLIWSQGSIQLSPDEILTPNQMPTSQEILHESQDSVRPVWKSLDDLKNVSLEDKVEALNIIIPELKDLSGVSDVNFVSLVRLVGGNITAEIKKEANYFRSTESRHLDKTVFSASEILEKRLKIESLHVFFESCTKKSGRVPGQNQETIAGHQADFYESVMKGANLHSVPPFNFLKTSQVLNKVPSRQVTKQNVGGSYTMHHNLLPSKPLPDTHLGPLISDNAQRGTG